MRGDLERKKKTYVSERRVFNPINVQDNILLVI